MCGIVGIIGQAEPGVDFQLVQTGVQALRHRGPDGLGVWVAPEGGVVLGHARLAIVDLTEAGAQPMQLSDRYVLTYNGEIYNASDLKAQYLAGQPFFSKTDTETVLRLVDKFGLDGALALMNGMFAFALFDRQKQVAYLVRDRLGKKPLYYWVDKLHGRVAFASELRALKHLPGFPDTLDIDYANHYLAFGYGPAEHTPFRDIFKVRPGHYVSVSVKAGLIMSQTCYWSLHNEVQKQERFWKGEPEGLEALDALIRDATRIRSFSSDVRVGAFLSGGIDSSVIAAYHNEVADNPVQTYTVIFEGVHNFEQAQARAVADYIGSIHTELVISQADVNRCRDLWADMDEPFADTSLLPTYLLCQAVRKEATVVLTGDGGDELFAGYRHYVSAMWDAQLRWARPLALILSGCSFSPRYRRALRRLGMSVVDAYLDRVLIFSSEERGAILGQTQPTVELDGPERDRIRLYEQCPIRDFGNQLAWAELHSSLVDDILMKVDRASMLASVELRSPLLDYRLVVEAMKIPYKAKVMGKQRKVPLVWLGQRLLPRSFDYFQKQGFGLPTRLYAAHQGPTVQNPIHLNGPLSPYQEWTLRNLFRWCRAWKIKDVESICRVPMDEWV